MAKFQGAGTWLTTSASNVCGGDVGGGRLRPERATRPRHTSSGMKLDRISGRWTGRPKVFIAVVLALYAAAATWIGYWLWWLAHHST